MRFLIRNSPLFFVLILIFSCQSTPLKPKIAIAGLAIESSTFSPAKTEASAFLARQGEKVFDYYPFFLRISSPSTRSTAWHVSYDIIKATAVIL